MDKPIVLIVKEFKEKASATLNEYINILPADSLADFYESLTIQLRQLAAKQVEEAERVYEASKTE